MGENFNLNSIIRENIKKLKPYSTARDEFKGQASIWLDANENPFGSPLHHHYHRYPDPKQWKLKDKITQIKGVPPQNIILGNGSDEIIDLLYRAFCTPGKDNVIVMPPTYGIYEVSANINDIEVKKVPLTMGFQMDLDGIAEAIDENTKLIFICSPNNPTGNSLFREDVETLLANFKGIVVVDEAYINYSQQKSFIQELTEYGNLFVSQTFSKAWGLAGLRLGMGFASEEIIEVLNSIKPPYNINQATQDLAFEALDNVSQVNEWIQQTVLEREKLVKALVELPFVQKIYPSDANFILVKMDNAHQVYLKLCEKGVILRDRSQVEQLEDCIRITVGTAQENKELVRYLAELAL